MSRIIKKFQILLKKGMQIDTWTLVKEGDFSDKLTYNDLSSYLKDIYKRKDLVEIKRVR